MTGIPPLPPAVSPPSACQATGLRPLRRNFAPAAVAVPCTGADKLEQGLVGARTASRIGETTLQLMRDTGVKGKMSASPVNWVTMAGFADGLALSVEDPKAQSACMLAGHYGGYRFGLAAPLIGRGTSLVALTGVTAAAIVPQMMAQTLSDPTQLQAPAEPPNTKARNRAAVVGGTVGVGLTLTTLATHPGLMKPATAIPLLCLGACSGSLDGVAAVTNVRREQAIATSLGHVAGFAMIAAVPGMATATRSGLTRTGIAGVSLAPFVAAGLDAKKHPQLD
jgi:hypothetical protein